jgi:4-diphosphocytidyl-2-C-methyl-D-erythritol kinase
MEGRMTEGATFTREAPAKVNLSLRILGKRADGFHELETRMVRVDLADRLAFTVRPAGSGLRFACDDASLPGDETNLVVRALRALERREGRSFDLDVRLEKRIPHGAGLGGGSSDAAAALRAVNEGLGLGRSREDLAELAAALGSDIPFFLWEGACDCRGRGEIVTPVPEFPWRIRLLLVKPAFSVATPWAYRAWQDSRELPGVGYGPQPMPWGDLVNDLERPVFAKHLVLAELKRFLREREEVAGALLSGSGSVMFAVLREDAADAGLRAAVAAEFGDTTWTQPVTVLP